MANLPDLDKYAHLWTSDLSEHFLVAVRADEAGADGYLIYNIKNRYYLGIENNDVAKAVIEHMLQSGCVVVEVADPRLREDPRFELQPQPRPGKPK